MHKVKPLPKVNSSAVAHSLCERSRQGHPASHARVPSRGLSLLFQPFMPVLTRCGRAARPSIDLCAPSIARDDGIPVSVPAFSSLLPPRYTPRFFHLAVLTAYVPCFATGAHTWLSLRQMIGRPYSSHSATMSLDVRRFVTGWTDVRWTATGYISRPGHNVRSTRTGCVCEALPSRLRWVVPSLLFAMVLAVRGQGGP